MEPRRRQSLFEAHLSAMTDAWPGGLILPRRPFRRRPAQQCALFPRMINLCARALDRADYLITGTRLGVLDRLAGLPPETRTDRVIRSRASGCGRHSRRSISTIPPAASGELLL
jgi:hypothetical protein